MNAPGVRIGQALEHGFHEASLLIGWCGLLVVAHTASLWLASRNSWVRSAGTFQDESEMIRNFLEWRRPEGDYPERDGTYIVVAPTLTMKEQRQALGT